MEQGRGRAGRVAAMAVAAVALLAAGAIGATLVIRHGAASGEAAVAAAEATQAPPTAGTALGGHAGHGAPAAAPAAREAVAPGEVRLAPEALAQAGIRTARVESRAAAAVIEVPGIVTPNAYREVKVTPLVGGQVVEVHAELGAGIGRGAPLVTLFSSDLAEAQNRYLSMRAMAETERRKLDRIREVAAIGAASRQQVEEATAAYASRAAELAAARQRLLVLGLDAARVDALAGPDDVVSKIVVRAPMAGVVTTRSANRGLVVEPGRELLTVTELSEVWVVGDLYERDFAAVAVGSPATVTTSAYPDLRLPGRVSYIDPRVDPATRTAKVRVAVPNRERRLRLGMYATLALSGGTRGPEVVVPRSAVQAIGDRHVVYVAVGEHEGHFAERAIRTGRLLGDVYTVLEGLRPGEVVVTDGSFYLRSARASR